MVHVIYNIKAWIKCHIVTLALVVKVELLCFCLTVNCFGLDFLSRFPSLSLDRLLVSKYQSRFSVTFSTWLLGTVRSTPEVESSAGV